MLPSVCCAQIGDANANTSQIQNSFICPMTSITFAPRTLLIIATLFRTRVQAFHQNCESSVPFVDEQQMQLRIELTLK